MDKLDKKIIISIPAGQALVVQQVPQDSDAGEFEYHIGENTRCTITGYGSKITFYCAQNSDLTYCMIIASDPSINSGRTGEGVLQSSYTHDIKVVLQGARARARIRGLYLMCNQKKLMIRSRQEHQAPDTQSDLVLKGVLAGQSQVTYEGMVYIAPGARRSRANQQNKNILLSSRAYARSIPSFEVLTNDVICTHGSAVGQLDPAQLFYLQARGLDLRGAKGLLVKGFIADILDDMPDINCDELLSGIVDKIVDKIV